MAYASEQTLYSKSSEYVVIACDEYDKILLEWQGNCNKAMNTNDDQMQIGAVHTDDEHGV